MNVHTPLGAGVVYGVAGFAIGFVFGVVRTLFVVPQFGVLAAVAMEVPLMLLACLPLAAWCVHRWHLSRPMTALFAGTVGFCVLVCCEFLLGLALGNAPSATLAAMGQPAGLLGLVGQGMFALLMPGLALAKQLTRD